MMDKDKVKISLRSWRLEIRPIKYLILFLPIIYRLLLNYIDIIEISDILHFLLTFDS